MRCESLFLLTISSKASDSEGYPQVLRGLRFSRLADRTAPFAKRPCISGYTSLHPAAAAEHRFNGAVFEDAVDIQLGGADHKVHMG